MRAQLLTPKDVDAILRYPNGRAARLARADKLPHIVLPDGEIRFDRHQIEKLLSPEAAGEAVHNAD